MLKKKRIIILGSKGFIGSSIFKYLKKKNYKILGISRREIDFIEENSSKKLEKIIKKNDIIVNAIAVAPCKTYQDLNKNLKIIQNIQQGLSKFRLLKYYNISSDAVYPDTKNKINEKLKIDPSSIHGLMHLNREKIIDLTSNCNVLHIRPTLVYGFGDTHNGYGPNLFFENIKKNKTIKIFGNGEEIRDHIFIKDLTHLFEKILNKNCSGVLNFVTGNGITFMQIAKELQKKYKKVKIIKIPRKQKKMPHDGYRVFNNVKIKKLLPNFNFTNLSKSLDDIKLERNEKNKSS